MPMGLETTRAHILKEVSDPLVVNVRWREGGGAATLAKRSIIGSSGKEGRDGDLGGSALAEDCMDDSASKGPAAGLLPWLPQR